MFDSIIVTLPCGGEAREGEIQTHIRGSAAGDATITIGYAFDPGRLTPESLERNGYVLMREPGPGEPIRLLDIWSCIDCGAEQWAMIEIADGALRRVEAVELDCATLDAAHYIDELNAGLAAAALGSGSGQPAVEALRRLLAS